MVEVSDLGAVVGADQGHEVMFTLFLPLFPIFRSVGGDMEVTSEIIQAFLIYLIKFHITGHI